MAYCTASELIGMLKDDMMDVIIGDDYIEDREERIRAITPLAKEAAEDAQSEIDGYLAKRYNVPFARTPKVINKFAKDIREPDEKVQEHDRFHIPMFYWNYRKLDGRWQLDGGCLLGSDLTVHKVTDTYRASITHSEAIRQARMHRSHNLYYCDGTWMCNGERMLDAWEQETIIGYDLHYLDGSWILDGNIILDGIENQEVAI